MSRNPNLQIDYYELDGARHVEWPQQLSEAKRRADELIQQPGVTHVYVWDWYAVRGESLVYQCSNDLTATCEKEN